MIRKIIPIRLKITWKLFKRVIDDIIKGNLFKYAKSKSGNTEFSYQNELTQDLKPNENKLHNLKLAIKAIELVEIKPNEIFSFWKIVGYPSLKNGFINSRSITNGKIQDTVGGGLCQLSGLIYYISIKSGLQIIERHNHSLDIYNDETRFTPLGSDATVAFAYRDLRIKNNLKSVIKYSFSINKEKITVKLLSSEKLKKYKVAFKINELGNNKIEVKTMVNDTVVTNSIYQRASNI